VWDKREAVLRRQDEARARLMKQVRRSDPFRRGRKLMGLVLGILSGARRATRADEAQGAGG
jgi:hypothetical protein